MLVIIKLGAFYKRIIFGRVVKLGFCGKAVKLSGYILRTVNELCCGNVLIWCMPPTVRKP